MSDSLNMKCLRFGHFMLMIFRNVFKGWILHILTIYEARCHVLYRIYFAACLFTFHFINQ